MRLTIIVPAYNEAEGVSQTAERLRQVIGKMRANKEVELLFIDDGSRDETAALLQREFDGQPDVRIISHPVNRGLGAAIRTGFQNATGDVVVTTDFDGTYDFALIPALVEQLFRENVDIVTASPYHPQGAVEGVPQYRLLFSFGASLVYRLLINWHIYCWTALFRAYRRCVVESVGFTSDDFLAGTELLVNALQMKYRVAEFPATLRQRSFGRSSLRIARVTLAHLKFQARIATKMYGMPHSEVQARPVV